MPAYNFQKQFAPLVESGEKTCTIRATDKGAKVGDTAYLYTGLGTLERTKQCGKLGEGTIIAVLPIKIWRGMIVSPAGNCGDLAVILSATITAPCSLLAGLIMRREVAKIGYQDEPLIYDCYRIEHFAKAAGFQSADEMISWFKEQYGLPFNGYLHTWILNKP